MLLYAYQRAFSPTTAERERCWEGYSATASEGSIVANMIIDCDCRSFVIYTIMSGSVIHQTAVSGFQFGGQSELGSMSCVFEYGFKSLIYRLQLQLDAIHHVITNQY